MTAAALAAILTAAGLAVRRRGNGQHAALCPTHKKRGYRPVEFGDGRDGLVITCHCGCDTARWLAAFGIAPADLFRPNRGPATLPTSTYREGSRGNRTRYENIPLPVSVRTALKSRGKDGARRGWICDP